MATQHPNALCSKSTVPSVCNLDWTQVWTESRHTHCKQPGQDTVRDLFKIRTYYTSDTPDTLFRNQILHITSPACLMKTKDWILATL